MATLAELQHIALKLSLTLDSPKSVKLQIKQINLLQKQLRAIKQELSVTISSINQDAAQSSPDSLVSFGLDVFGKQKWAGRLRAGTRRETEREKKLARQPYLEIKQEIDNLILAGDRLKLRAEEYLISYQE